MANNWRNFWGPDKEIKMTYGEKLGAWISYGLVFTLGVWVGHLF